MDAMIEHKMSLRNCRRLWIGNWNEGKYNYPINNVLAWCSLGFTSVSIRHVKQASLNLFP